jgi:hypothetical protein
MSWLKSVASIAVSIRVIWSDIVFLFRDWQRKQRIESDIDSLRDRVDGLFDRTKADPANVDPANVDDDAAE